MDFIKNWAIMISAFIIITTIVEMLLPSQSIKKYAKLVLSLMLIVLVIKPILHIDIDLPSYEISDAASSANSAAVSESFAANLAIDMESKLKKYGNLKFKVELEIEKGNQFIIKNIIVSNCNEQKRTEVRNELIEIYGCHEVRFT